MKAWMKYVIDAAILLLMGVGGWFVYLEGQFNGEQVFLLVLVAGGLFMVNHGAFQSAGRIRKEAESKFRQMNQIDGDPTPMRGLIMARKGALNGRSLGSTTYLACTDRRLLTQSASFAFAIRGRSQAAFPWESVRSAQLTPNKDGTWTVVLDLNSQTRFSFTVARQGMEGTDFGDQTRDVQELLEIIQRHAAPNVPPVIPWA